MTDPTNRPLTDWLSDLDRSEEEIAAGQVVSMAPGRARLRETIAELEAKLEGDKRRKAAPRR